MGVPYHDILAAVAMRTNALNGASAAALETTYNVRPLTAANFQSTIFPFTDYRTAILSAEQKLAQVIAPSNDEAMRAPLFTQTAALASGAVLPAVNSAGVSIIGHYGAVLDGTDTSVACTKQPVQVIRRRLATPAIWKIPVYYFAYTGNRIEHTRTTVILECPVYDYEAQVTAFNANDDMLLADGLMEALICGGMTMLVRDDEWLSQAQQFVTYFNNTLARFVPAEKAA